MTKRQTPRVRYDSDKLMTDLALRGWNQTDLARAARLSPTTIMKFCNGSIQTAKVCAKIAGALGYASPKRYVLGVVSA